MATQTTNYGLTKPSYNETADIGVINSNMDIIDAKMKAIENKAGSGGGGGNTDTYGHVKVGSVTIDASGDDTIELVAGSNVTLTPDTTSKSVTISATGGGSGTSDYLQLSNKPKINGIELVDNLTTENLGIVVPQYTSELENDSGFITNEADPTVPAWAKEPTKPTYTAEEVGALPSNTPIPDPTSVVVDRFVSVGTHIADISVNGEKTELYAPTGGGGTSVTVDSELSTTSENPVQNKVITQALNEKSNLISDAWNASTTYEVGQYCIYNNSLWKCLVQHNGQAPTEGTYWTKVSVANEITSVNNSLIANSKHFYFDYKDGKYGYNTNPSRGADTFFPFKNGFDGEIFYISQTTIASDKCYLIANGEINIVTPSKLTTISEFINYSVPDYIYVKAKKKCKMTVSSNNNIVSNIDETIVNAGQLVAQFGSLTGYDCFIIAENI